MLDRLDRDAGEKSKVTMGAGTGGLEGYGEQSQNER